ncbi:MAG: RsmB/NOP family class I SAM-dependent RNA methyltransferase [Pseudomonadota bacterium]
MRPEARIAAAIEILDSIRTGAPAEQRLTSWARGNRYAGSGDRAAIRDIVFDTIRRRRSYAWLGGGETGRALMIGALRATNSDLEDVFTGGRHAPPRLSEDELSAGSSLSNAPAEVSGDFPDWLWPELAAAYGDQCADIAGILRDRAPVFLRINHAKATGETAVAALAQDGIEARPHPLAPSALEVLSHARRVRTSEAYLSGLVELQDAASQAVVSACLKHLGPGANVLDYCAGGGGKALAFAAEGMGPVVAHDADPKRMEDIPARAARAGTPIDLSAQPKGPFDLVLCDAPCSGSGAWRRQPQGKWDLTEARLIELTETQDEILATAQQFVGSGGALAYATCSLLPRENADRVEAFLARFPAWNTCVQQQWTPLDGGDGFFLAIFKHN